MTQRIFKQVFFLSIFGWLLAFNSTAQKQVLKGNVLDKQTTQPVKTASIKNIFTGNIVVSRSAGQFSIPVSKGNILSFSATGFYTDTLTITDSVLQLEQLTISMRPLPATLQNVVVTAQLNPYQLDSLERRRNFLATVGEAKIPTVSKANELGFGVAINIDHFSKRENKKRVARELFDVTENEAYINYRWNDTLVHKYTNFTGDKLIDFMQAYRPEWQWLRQNEDEDDMVDYINKSLKKFKKL